MAKTVKSKASGKQSKPAAKGSTKKAAVKAPKVKAAAAGKTTRAGKTQKSAVQAAAPKVSGGLAQVSTTNPNGKSSSRKTPAPVAIKPRPIAPPPAVREPEETPPLTEAQLRKVDTGLTRKDLEHYRQLLLQKRAEIIGDVESLQVDTKNNGGNLSHMPVHMADIGSDHYEQEFTLGLVESERKLLREIDDALIRIQKGIYGVCLERGVPIGRARLDAKPWAKYCIEVVREMEKRGRY